MPAVHLLIKGKVQGVFYRASAKEFADKLNIKGWIKNTNESHVEAMANGDDAAIKKFIEWCKEGPRHAIVSEVIVEKSGETAFQDFVILR